MDEKYFYSLPGMDYEEFMMLKQGIHELTEEQQRHFVMIYQGRRRDPQIILLSTLAGFLGFAGLQRFLTNQIGMGILYFFTAGLCLIGTIVDLVNYKDLALNYNRSAMYQSLHFAKMMNGQP
jgi:TM2 domain-containing membrane protein YozV